LAYSIPIRFGDRAVASVDPATGELAYDSDWLDGSDSFPISLSMPLADGPFVAGAITIPWLSNLLPEGDPLRALSEMTGISSEDVLGLLNAAGGDVAGALSVGDHEPNGSPDYDRIPDDAALEKIIAELPARPFLAGEEGVSMSLAGAQSKLPVFADEAGIAIPVNGAPSTHILKPDNPRLPGSVQNEALCMVLARRTGLPVAPVTTGTAGSRSYLLVTRYDRESAGGGTGIRRIHQEDFCQASGRFPGAKYEFNGTGRRGPSLPDLFGLVRDHMTARDINRLLDAVIFNVATGNVDAHAKNYSILLRPGSVELAPLYDLMSGLVWDGITSNNAQEIGGQRRSRYIYGRHWLRMAEAANLSGRGAVRQVESLVAKLLVELDATVEEVAAMPAGPGPMLGSFADAIRGLATEVLSHAREDAPPATGAAPVGSEAASPDRGYAS
jgi:serine/threonine-protein kinase HipA